MEQEGIQQFEQELQGHRQNMETDAHKHLPTIDFFQEPSFYDFPDFHFQVEVDQEEHEKNYEHRPPYSQGKAKGLQSYLPLIDEPMIMGAVQIPKRPKSSPPSLEEIRKSREEIDEIGPKLVGEYKNETKNIPKNFGKAIIKYMKRSKNKLQPYLRQENIDFQLLYQKLRSHRDKLTTIAELRNLWVEWPESKVLRAISQSFLSKNCIQYLYNSKIMATVSHLRYRKRLLEAIKNPSEFNCLKNF